MSDLSRMDDFEELFDSLSPYETAVLAFTWATNDDDQLDNHSNIVVAGKPAYIWAGAIAHAMVYNPKLNPDDIYKALRMAVADVAPRMRSEFVDGDIGSANYFSSGEPFVYEFLRILGFEGDEFNVVIAKTQDAIQTLEWRGLIVDPFSRRLKNALIGVLLVFPLSFSHPTPDGFQAKALLWEVSRQTVENKPQWGYKIKIKEAVEVFVKTIIPTFIEIVDGFASGDEPKMTTGIAQEKLAALGYYSGPIDGKAGPRTINALRLFQKDRALEITGRLDPRTIAALQNN